VSVCLSVLPSVTRLLCDETKEPTAAISIPRDCSALSSPLADLLQEGLRLGLVSLVRRKTIQSRRVFSSPDEVLVSLLIDQPRMCTVMGNIRVTSMSHRHDYYASTRM